MQRYQTIVMEARCENTSTNVAPMDTKIVLQDALRLNSQKRTYIKPISAQISTRIPNIFSYGAFNNTIIRVKRNVADAWTVITLTPGVYLTVSEIGAAVTAATSTWHTNPASPAIRIDANTVTDKVFIILDSSKLAAGGTQACIDLSQSQIAFTLGFPAATSYIADGTYTSSQVVRMDTQGTKVDIVCSLTTSRVINGVTKKILFSVPMVAMTGYTEYLYPQLGEPTPLIQYQGNTFLSNYDINFQTTFGTTMVFLGGSRCSVIFEMQEEL